MEFKCDLISILELDEYALVKIVSNMHFVLQKTRFNN